MVNGNWEEKRRCIFERPKQRMSQAARPAGGGVTGELVLNGSSGPSPGMDRSVLKDRSREESACEKSVALIRRPAQDREQP